jgi:hypothetical protein
MAEFGLHKRVRIEFAKKKIKTDIDDFERRVIRITINEFHTAEAESHILPSLLSVLEKEIDFSGGRWAVWKIIRDVGFMLRKQKNNKLVFIEI